MHRKATPAGVMKLTRRAMIGSAVVAAGVMTAWVLGLLPDARLTLAAYITLLVLAVGNGCVALLAALHLAIRDAFKAGYQTGQVAATMHDDPVERAQLAREAGKTDPLLRLIRSR